MQDLVTVFGGSGFVGAQVVRALAKQGWRVRVAVRQPHLAYTMRLLGDVGQIEVVQANIRNEASIRRAVEGAHAVVNAVGVLYETGRQKFQSIHTMGARNVAAVSKAAGVDTLVQISAIGVDAESGSKYARTKAMGENAVREAFPGAVFIRPSVIFGPDDHFFNKFAEMAVISPALPLIGGGEGKLQPVFVGDVAKAVARAVTDPACAGQTYELGGPRAYSFRELMELLMTEIGRKRFLVPLPFAIAALIGKACEILALTPWTPPLTEDQVELLKSDNVVSGTLPGLAELGVEATAVEGIVPAYLYRFRKGGQYADEVERLTAIA
ncbi:MAG: complex I NDUFA9 subunit family protein [Phenylobacterium sp.]|nr:complex I NDUFA9 subunit family protein [Phenylobacterium sp.]